MNDSDFPIQPSQNVFLQLVYGNSPYAEHINILIWINSPFYFLFSDIYRFALIAVYWRNTDRGEW